jgi:hypothetical protein
MGNQLLGIGNDVLEIVVMEFILSNNIPHREQIYCRDRSSLDSLVVLWQPEKFLFSQNRSGGTL